MSEESTLENDNVLNQDQNVLNYVLNQDQNVLNNVLNNFDISDRQYQILQMIASNGKHTFATLADEFGVTTKTIQRDLDYLKQLGLLIREDGTRGKWIVLTSNRI